MSRLILLRHAESDRTDGSLFDFDRPLSDRGRRDLPVVAEGLLPFLEENFHVLCSPALRAKQTFALAESWWPACKIKVIDKLYECGISELVQAVRAIEDKQTCAIIIGHNPGLIKFLNWCLADTEFTTDCYHMPTSTAAVLDFPVVFSEVQEGQARLTTYLRAGALMR